MTDTSFEKHYTFKEISAIWGVSYDTVRRAFEREPGVLRFEERKTGTRSYGIVRVPESVMRRVHTRLLTPPLAAARFAGARSRQAS